MILNRHQNIALQKILKNDKSFIIWPRREGKTYLTFYVILDYVYRNQKNLDKDIFIVSNKINYLHNYRSDFIKFLSKYTNHNIINKMKKDSIIFFNNTCVSFHIIDNTIFNHNLRRLKPELIIYDDIDMNEQYYDIIRTGNFHVFSKSDLLFTSSYYNNFLISDLDSQNSFYLNIIVGENTKKISLIDSFLKQRKTKEMYDFNYMSYIRKKKLEKINQISGC